MQPSKPARDLIRPETVRAILTAKHPKYGKDFTPDDWARITERLVTLARLFWQISERRANPTRKGEHERS